MPIFEYKCPKCGKKTEFLENSSGKNVKNCPVCGGKMEKQFSTFSAGISKAGQSKKCTGCSDHTCPHSQFSGANL